MEALEFKTCSKCNKDLPLTDFLIRNKAKGIYYGVCRPCKTSYIREWYNKNPDKVKAIKIRKAEKLKADIPRYEKVKKRGKDRLPVLRQWEKEHPDRIKASRERRKPKLRLHRINNYRNNKDPHKVGQANKRAKDLKVPGHITLNDWLEIKASYGNRCVYCGVTSVELELEHFWPLSLANKGLDISRFATNELDNILPVCSFCNSAKKNRPFIIFLAWKNGCLM